jgi:hypothetical protein
VNPGDLLDDLKQRGLRLLACGDVLIVDAPRDGVTTDMLDRIAANKRALLTLLAVPVATGGRSPLVEYAADRTPPVRLTIRETGDAERDLDLLHRVLLVIGQHQPGGNHVYLRIVSQDRRRVVVEWRALAEPALRLGLARALAESATRGGATR